ncbi:MAG: HAD family phosphatase, partial [Deltaproteobacteria bacterium]
MTRDLVIFDCDGVIIDSERMSNDMLADDLRGHGLELSVTEIDALFVGGTISGLAESARAMGATLGPNWVEEFYAKLYIRLAGGAPLVPGILPVLEQ